MSLCYRHPEGDGVADEVIHVVEDVEVYEHEDFFPCYAQESQDATSILR